MTIVFWSTTLMLTTAVLCALGLLSRTFKDNLWQTVGMWAGMIGCGSRVPDIWSRNDIPFDWFLVHLCLGLFAIGTAWKIIKAAHKAKIERFTAAMRERAHIAEWVRSNGSLVHPEHNFYHRRKDDLQ